MIAQTAGIGLKIAIGIGQEKDMGGDRLMRVAAACSLAVGALYPGLALAQSPFPAIIVTGERSSRTVEATGSSVAVLGAEQLELLSGADRLDQVLGLIPNLQLGSGAEGPTIRGQDSNGALRDLPAFLGGTRPRVTVQVDGRPISYNELAFGVSNLWDVARVEVFRSPQTTTQGRNAIAGGIFVETAQPAFDWEGRLRATAGSDAMRQGSGVVSGPIISDQVAFRAAFDIRRGQASSRITSAIAPAIDYVRDDYDVVRLRLLARPQALPGLRLEAIGSHVRSAAPQIEGVRAPFRARRDPVATYGAFRQRVEALTLRAEYLVGTRWSAKLTATAGDASTRRIAPSGFGESRISARDWTGEAILSGTLNTKLSVLLGTNITQATVGQDIDLSRAQLGLGEFDDRQDAFGVFGQADWRPVARVSIQAGGRFQNDSQRRRGALGVGTATALPLDYVGRSQRLLPKLTIAFEPRAGWRIGGMVQRAYNPGGVTLDGGRRVANAFGPETLWAYEAFARATALDDTLLISANAFHYDIRDAQRSLTRELQTPGGVVTFAEIGNAPKARSSGAELQLAWKPSEVFSLQSSLGLLRTRLTRAQSPSDPLQGKEFQRSPHLTASLLADWRPLDGVALAAQVRHNAGYFSDDANDPLRRVGSATVADVRASWTQGALTASGFVRNLFDSFDLTYLFAPSSRLATAGDPREFGASLEMRF